MLIVKPSLRAAGLFSLLLVTNAAVQAQQLPGPASPGQVEKQFERVPVPAFPERDFVPGRRDVQPPPGAEDVVFRLRAVRFEGTTVFETPELEALAADYLDRDISLGDLYALANRVTATYRNAGYVLSQAVVPAQEIGEDRVAAIRVVEGFISAVMIEGVDDSALAKVRDYVDHIVMDRPLTAAVLERNLLLVNDLTGVTARAVLVPSPTVPGAADLRVSVARDGLSGYAGATNRGSRFQGPWQIVGQAESSDTLGGYGGLRAFGVVSADADELQHVTLSRTQFVGPEGTAVSGTFSHTSTRPGAFLSVFEIDTDSDNLDLAVQHPFQRSRTRNLAGRVRLSVYRGTSRRLDVPGSGAGDLEVRQTRDNIRSLRMGFSYDWVDRFRGVNIVDAELSQGLDILGASETPSPLRSRPDGDGGYIKANLYAARIQQITGPWSVLASLSGQYSADPLLKRRTVWRRGSQLRPRLRPVGDRRGLLPDWPPRAALYPRAGVVLAGQLRGIPVRGRGQSLPTRTGGGAGPR